MREGERVSKIESVPMDSPWLTPSPLFHAEWHMGTAVLLRTFQSYEPHAVYWVWHVPPGGHDRRVADHPQHDCGRYLLRHVCGPRHRANPISRLVSTAVPGEGESRWRAADSGCWRDLCWREDGGGTGRMLAHQLRACFYFVIYWFSPKFNVFKLSTTTKNTLTS